MKIDNRGADLGGFDPDLDPTFKKENGSDREENSDPDPTLEKQTKFWPNIGLYIFFYQYDLYSITLI